MKRMLSLLLCALMLSGCAGNTVAQITETTRQPSVDARPIAPRFDTETSIQLSDGGITVEGREEAVHTSHDIIYYEDKDTYESGNPYGEGEANDRHSAAEAAAHTVVNITQPGAYRVSGKLSAGQIRIDLGEDAYEDPEAVVELILDGADITCTVAPAILFLNTYECDGDWSEENASANVDTSAAGANLILESENKVSGSYVARIFKDQEGEKKLWKQDGAIYSYMSMNVWGEGSLDLTADNEGLDTELHLTIHGGDIRIRSGNDGINTNEDGVSVTTINAGTLYILAGLGAEGDGIDSNGYLVINGGTVVASAHPASDAGLDSDLGSYINGGTVIALGSTMDWAESDSRQVTMNLQFAAYQEAGSAIVVTDEKGTPIFAYDPSQDEILGENQRKFQGAILSSPDFQQGQTYHVYLGGSLTGEETGGIYATVRGYADGTQMAYTGTDMPMGHSGGMGQPPEGMEEMTPPEGFGGERPALPEGETMPEGFDPGAFGGPGERPEGTPPENFDGEMPAPPEGNTPRPGGRNEANTQPGEASTEFYMQDKVNAFTGVTPA